MDSISNERTDEDGKLVSGKGVKSVEGLLVYQKERKKKKKREKKKNQIVIFSPENACRRQCAKWLTRT